ncbi:MAG: XRE family transcriptional regulator [Bacteroidia bacterium]
MAKKKDYTEERIIKISQKIKELRIKANYTSAENFAYDNELNRVQYWRVENGANITLKTLLKILDIHKITLSDFFKGI